MREILIEEIYLYKIDFLYNWLFYILLKKIALILFEII